MSIIKLAITVGALPCPCCGSRSVGIFEDWFNGVEDDVDCSLTYYIKCVHCDTQSGYYKVESDAIEAWNRREPWEPAPQTSFGETPPPNVSSIVRMASDPHKAIAPFMIEGIGDLGRLPQECHCLQNAA